MQALLLAALLGAALWGGLAVGAEGALALMGAGPEAGRMHDLAKDFLLIRWVPGALPDEEDAPPTFKESLFIAWMPGSLCRRLRLPAALLSVCAAWGRVSAPAHGMLLPLCTRPTGGRHAVVWVSRSTVGLNN
jgi:hypothetical protein